MSAEEDYAEAQRRIAKARETGATELDLNELQDLDRFPPEISGLTRLQSVQAWLTSVSDLSPLQSLSYLHTLHLFDTQVSDLTPLQSLSNLQILGLDGTQISDFTPLQGLSNLLSLTLSSTQVSDFTPLQSLSNLQSLDLDGTQISDFIPLQGLSNLQSLGLNHTQASDLTPLRGLSNLQSLGLNHTQVSDLTALQSLSNLQRLDLDRTQVTDLTPLQSLSNLQRLTLNSTQVSDLAPLQGLSKLFYLDLNKTAVTDLRPLCDLQFQPPQYSIINGLRFQSTPALRDETLKKLADIEDNTERTQKTLAYLRTLPPPPAPLPWQTADASDGEPRETPPAPGPRLAPIMVEMRDGALHTVSPGTGLEQDAQDRAQMGWAALRSYLSDLSELRARMNNMPNLQRAILSLDRALGDSFAQMNPVDVGMQGERVIRLSKDCDTYLMDQDPEEVRAMAAQVSLYLRRFQVWDDFRTDPAPSDVTPETLRSGAEDLRAFSNAIAQEDWIGDDVKEPLAEIIEQAVEHPDSEVDGKGALLSISNILDRMATDGIKLKVEMPGSVRGGLIVAGGGAVATGAIAFLQNHPILLQRLSHTFSDTLWFVQGILRFLVPGI